MNVVKSQAINNYETETRLFRFVFWFRSELNTLNHGNNVCFTLHFFCTIASLIQCKFHLDVICWIIFELWMEINERYWLVNDHSNHEWKRNQIRLNICHCNAVDLDDFPMYASSNIKKISLNSASCNPFFSERNCGSISIGYFLF